LKILIDIGHPAHVHYYRNLARELEKRGNSIIWIAKNSGITEELMRIYGITSFILPQKSDKLSGKIWKQILYNYLIFKICRKYKIDIAIGTSVSIVHVSKISRVKSIVFDDDDDEVQPLITKYVNPFADLLVSPESLKGKRKRTNTIYYPGFHELAYLHPNRFLPDPTVLREVGLIEGDKYFILRFNAFKAHHDKGVIGLSLEQKKELIKILEPTGKVFITTERAIEPEISEYQLKIRPDRIHSLIYFSTIFIGDSQTMASEASVMGVPALRCNSLAHSISYLDELESKYGLTYSFLPSEFDQLIVKLKDLLSNRNLKSDWDQKRMKLLSEKIDVTAFWLWLVDNYPESTEMFTENRSFFHQFI
jgi:uncharacterized protein